MGEYHAYLISLLDTLHPSNLRQVSTTGVWPSSIINVRHDSQKYCHMTLGNLYPWLRLLRYSILDHNMTCLNMDFATTEDDYAVRIVETPYSVHADPLPLMKFRCFDYLLILPAQTPGEFIRMDFVYSSLVPEPVLPMMSELYHIYAPRGWRQNLGVPTAAEFWRKYSYWVSYVHTGITCLWLMWNASDR